MSIADVAARLRARFGWDGSAPNGHRRALVLLFGLPGTGKSFLAAAVATAHPAAVVRTDEVRRAVFEQPVYSRAESVVVYLTCYALLEALLADGYTVVFDGTNSLRDGRRRARAIAVEAGAPVLLVETVVPAEVVSRRLEDRAAGQVEPFSSQADWLVHQKLAAAAESAVGEERLVVDTSRDVAPALAAIAAFLASGTATAVGPEGAPLTCTKSRALEREGGDG